MLVDSNPRAAKSCRGGAMTFQATMLLVVFLAAIFCVLLLGKAAWWSIGIIALGLLGSMMIIFRDVIWNRLTKSRWGAVVPGKIYRSGQLPKFFVERTLRRYGIKVVINLRGRLHFDPGRVEESLVTERLGIERVWLPLSGNGTGNLQHYAQAIERMVTAEKENKPVLIHCAAGTQRTGGVVAAYRLLVEGASPAFVRQELIKYGWKPETDKVLLDYLNENMEALARTLVEKKVLERMPRSLPHLEPE